MNRCAKCILPDTYPGISFNTKGVCNYCTNWKDVEYLGSEALKEKMDNFLKINKDRNPKYDCIIGLSGGRDSSYLLYYTVKILGLRVLAYSADHGFIPKQTILNMQNMAKILKVPLIIEKHEYIKKSFKHHVRSWMRRPSAPMIGLLCTGCRFNIDLGLFKCAKKYRIPIVINGGTPFENEDYKSNIMKINPKNRKRSALVLGYMSNITKNPRWIMSPTSLITQLKEYYIHYYSKIFKKNNILTIQPFLYIRWKEDEVISTIQNELKWKKNPQHVSTWRMDCDIAILKLYLYKKMLGFNDQDVGLSCLIRDNQVSRKEALERLEKEGEIPEKAIKDLFQRVGLEYSDLQIALNEVQKKL